jgi:hypothetical protein
VAQLAVEILNLIDDHSRLAIASRFRPTVSSHDFVDVFTDAPSCRSRSANSASHCAQFEPLQFRDVFVHECPHCDARKHHRHNWIRA